MASRNDLDEIAEELYALPPAQFTAARNARAGMAERPIAAHVKALRKPSVSAWAVNLLAREGQLGDALELAAALREAQEDLDAAELSRLGRQRRALVAALATQAVGLAEDAGVTVSTAARGDIEKTINAAVMDAAAAAAVMTARLVTPLEAGAFEQADLADAVGGSVPGVAEPAVRDDLAERRARKAAEKAAREAERAANEAERELGRIEAQRQKLQERVDHVEERIGDLRRDLERLESEQAKAVEELTGIEAERTAAASRAQAAAKEAERARDAVSE
ncbi:transposase [Microbacterium sp. CFBP9034]|uniref:transposase n=1 Tax=Microbacterium sp. CFBP9034 TaxID=3096540 RepID=UPI002A6A7AE9|nr:transposase [Microbacterium sp. CFBP9034]MDY0910245.1 transposase [Microbacterium sp. CFBP9034]